MGCFPNKQKVNILTDIPEFKSRREGYGVEDKKQFIENFFERSLTSLKKVDKNRIDLGQNNRKPEI